MSISTNDTLPARPRQHGNLQRARRNRWFVPLLFAAMVAFSVLNVWLAVRRPALPEEIDGVQRYEALHDQVVAGAIDYELHPPVGGAHAELPQLCGIYQVPVADENLVASLATGAVWIAYQPELSSSQIERLTDAAQGEYDVLLTPYPGLDAPVVLTAWGRQLRVADASDERIEMFIAVYRNHERAPRVDETCARGVGLPPE